MTRAGAPAGARHRASSRASGASGYRLLPHTADVQLLVWGPSREACLEQAVPALAATFTSVGRATGRQGPSVVIPAGPDQEQLLALIEEALYLIDVDGRVPVTATVRRLPDGGLTVRFGTVPASDVVQTGSIPKAATRHALTFARSPLGWRARVTIDV